MAQAAAAGPAEAPAPPAPHPVKRRIVKKCPHDTRRHNCRACGGSSFCEHGKHRHGCADCQNLPCTMEGCPQFGHRFSSARALLQHMRTYHSGLPKALTKTKELSVYQALQAADIA